MLHCLLYVRVENDELVAGLGQGPQRDAASLTDELGHGVVLVLGDVDELAPVVHHPRQSPLLYETLHSVNDILRHKTSSDMTEGRNFLLTHDRHVNKYLLIYVALYSYSNILWSCTIHENA